MSRSSDPFRSILAAHARWLPTRHLPPGRQMGQRAILAGRTDLAATDLSHADLREAIFSGSKLTRANLTGANLRGADLEGADLSEAEGLSREMLGGANL